MDEIGRKYNRICRVGRVTMRAVFFRVRACIRFQTGIAPKMLLTEADTSRCYHACLKKRLHILICCCRFSAKRERFCRLLKPRKISFVYPHSFLIAAPYQKCVD